MSRKEPVAIGIVGTSWWSDAMYLPPLHGYRSANVVACCGRDRERTEQFAARWNIPHLFTDYVALIESGLCQALIVATANDTHHPITMRALEAGLHVLCEKPLGLNLAEARSMGALAHERNVITRTPFTYRYMPTTRYIKSLIDDGYLGRPLHLNLRYYAGYGRTSDYLWRFDVERAGSGALGDLASHFVYLARWFYGEIEAVCSQLGTLWERPSTDPQGDPYTIGDDTAMLMLRFRNGAHGSVHATTLAHEKTAFGQVHLMDFHGVDGTLRHEIDWDRVQTVYGAREGEKFHQLDVPDAFWGAARRDVVVETYKDMFRVEGHMVRDFVDSIVSGRPSKPDFEDGVAVQAVLEAALISAREQRWVNVA